MPLSSEDILKKGYHAAQLACHVNGTRLRIGSENDKGPL
jgi:hypothetical protein